MTGKALWGLAATAAGYTLVSVLPRLLVPSAFASQQVEAVALPVFVAVTLALLSHFGLGRLCGLMRPWAAGARTLKDALPYAVVLLVPAANLVASHAETIALSLATISIVLCAAIVEELIFRGFLLGLLVERDRRPLRAVLVTAAAFAFLHLLNPGDSGVFHMAAQGIVAGFTGMALGFIRLASGSIWPCILAHALVNITAGGAPTPNDGTSGLICVAAVIAGVVSLLWWKRQSDAGD